MSISNGLRWAIVHCVVALALHAQNIGTECSNPTPPSRLPVRIGEKYGFIDRAGHLVIKPQFDSIRNFVEGRAFVWLGGIRYAYIDESGSVVAETGYIRSDDNADFHEGLAVSCTSAGCGYIDYDGKLVILRRFKNLEAISSGAKRFSEGLAAVMIDGKWGFIDRAGTVVINPRFDDAEEFSEGLAAVQIGDDYGFIDKAGRMVVKPQFDLATRFSEDLARVRIGRDRAASSDPDGGWSKGAWGFINRQGKFIIPATFDFVEDFRCGVAIARTPDKTFGLIGPTGQWLVTPGDSRAGYFSDGLLPVKNSDKRYGYLTASGTVAIPYQFTSAGPFVGGLAHVEIGRVEGYIDTEGQFIWRFPSAQHTLETIEGGTRAWSVGSVEVHVNLPNVWSTAVMIPTCGGTSYEPRLCSEFVTLEQKSKSGWRPVQPKPSCCSVLGYPIGEYFKRTFISPGDLASTVYVFDPLRLQFDSNQLRLVVKAFENGELPTFRAHKSHTVLSQEFDLPKPPVW